MEVFVTPAVFYIIFRNSAQLPSSLECRKLGNNLGFTILMYLCFNWWKAWNRIQRIVECAQILNSTHCNLSTVCRVFIYWPNLKQTLRRWSFFMILGFWLLSTAPSLLIVSLPIPDGRSSLKISHVHLVKGIVIEVLPGSTAQNFQLANIMCFRLYWDYIPVSSFSGVLQLKRFSSCLYTIPVFYLW
jgi:hypothetical protein